MHFYRYLTFKSRNRGSMIQTFCIIRVSDYFVTLGYNDCLSSLENRYISSTANNISVSFLLINFSFICDVNESTSWLNTIQFLSIHTLCSFKTRRMTRFVRNFLEDLTYLQFCEATIISSRLKHILIVFRN